MRRYRVSWDMVKAWIKENGKLIKQINTLRYVAFVQALTEIDQLLATEPLSFGEAHNIYKNIELTICIGFRGPLVVHYGVNKKEQVVFVSGLAWRKFQ